MVDVKVTAWKKMCNLMCIHVTTVFFCGNSFQILFLFFHIHCLFFLKVCPDPSPWRGTPALYNSKVAVMDSGVIEGGLNVTLTIRLLMHGKVKPPISLSCQKSIFYDLFMEYGARMWSVRGWRISCSVHENHAWVLFNPPETPYYIRNLFCLICVF